MAWILNYATVSVSLEIVSDTLILLKTIVFFKKTSLDAKKDV